MVQYIDWARVRAAISGTRSCHPNNLCGSDPARALELAEARRLRVRPGRAIRPLSGVLAGQQKSVDRRITVVGSSLAVVAEFVTGLVLILVLLDLSRLAAGHRPVEAGLPARSRVERMTLPAITLTLVPVRLPSPASPASESFKLPLTPTTRAHILQRSPRRTDHPASRVLRSTLFPTIAVVPTQVGSLLSGLIAIELLFDYRGIGLTTLEGSAAERSCTMLLGWHPRHRFRLCVVTLSRRHSLRAS